MIGLPELLLILVVIAIFFFGKDKIIEWARAAGEAKKAYSDGAHSEKSKKKK